MKWTQSMKEELALAIEYFTKARDEGIKDYTARSNTEYSKQIERTREGIEQRATTNEY